MPRKAFVGTIAAVCVVALAAVFGMLPSSLPFPVPAYAQSNGAPEFPSTETGVRDVDENTVWFESIGNPVTATDPNNDKLTYSLENARKSRFTIDGPSGQLQVGAPLDYEAVSSYAITVIAIDPSGAKDTIDVTISVNNVEEDGKVSLTWTKPQVGVPITASLTDPDVASMADPGGAVSGATWQWSSSATRDGTYTDLNGNGAGSDTYTPQSGDVNKYLKVTATYTDVLGSGKTARAVSTATVQADPGGDNNEPEFDVDTGGGYTCSEGATEDVCLFVRRISPPGSEIYYPARATDPDGDEVRYSLGGTDSGLFTIQPFTGDLFTTGIHSYEGNGPYSIIITAADPSTVTDTDPCDPNTSDRCIAVALTPSGSKGAPVVTGPREIEYPENGTWPVAKYSAVSLRSPTIGWIVSVEPGGGDGDFFDIDDDGFLTFNQPPDYDGPADENRDNEYSFSIMAYDTNPPSEKRPGQTIFPVKVILGDVDESLEISGPSSIEYAENRTDAVATYAALRPSGQVTWSLSGDDSNKFSISRTGGVLAFRTQPDYDNPTDADQDNTYVVAVTATDSTDTRTKTVRVEVTDANEPPFFAQKPATRTVEENTAAGENIGDPVEATDPESNDLTYTLGGTDAQSFSINSSSGQLLTKDPLDHETKNSYSVTVSVTDNLDAQFNPDTTEDDSITVTIRVTGKNESPEFSQTGSIVLSVDENTRPGRNIGDPVSATDEDNDRLTYTLEGTDADSFNIVSTTGQIRTKSGVTYDYEGQKTSYSVTVKVDDGNGGTDTVEVIINVVGVNEPPAFPATSDSREVDENTPSNGIVGGPVAATDPEGDGLTYSLSGTNASSFTIDTSTGQIRVGADTTLDHETKPTYRVNVSVSDGMDADGNSNDAADDTIAIIINVTDVNEPPVFDMDAVTLVVMENTAPGGNVGSRVTAKDPERDTLTYILGGTDASSFTIDGGTGQIKVDTGTTLDRETKPSYSVTVAVRDSKNVNGNADTASDATVTVTINVTDQNEPPEITSGLPTVNYAENGAHTVAIYSATDPEEATITWSVTGTDAGDFSITNGELTFRSTPDYEKPVDGNRDNTYLVTIRASDGRYSDTLAVQVTVTNVNEPPSFPDTSTTRTVLENTAADRNVGTPVKATDPGNGQLTYTLAGTDASSFTIDSGTGQIKVRSGATLNHETKSSYTVTVRARESADFQKFDTITVTITVTDQNEPPEITAGPTTLNYAENREDAVGTYTATDPEGATIDWSLAGDDSGDFSITEGELTFRSSPDYESPADRNKDNKYVITVRASDGASYGTRDVEITVTNVNESPLFSRDAVTLVVVENTAVDGNVGSPVTAKDPEGGTLTYSLSGTDRSSFTIDSGTGQIKVGQGTTLDHETKSSYAVIVTASDGSLSDTLAVTINVTGQNEPPEITSGPTTVNYAENRDDTVAIYTATDPEGATITWSLTGDDRGDFSITGGELKFRSSPDYEIPADGNTDNVYLVTVRASDGSNSDTLDVQVTVTNVNEPPAFESDDATLSVIENTASGGNVGGPVAAKDPEGDTLTYTLAGTDASSFTIDSGTGQIKVGTGTTLDHETKSSYNVTVSVRDSKNEQGNADTQVDDTIAVTINIDSANQAPVFPNSAETRDIPENTGADTNVGTPVAASDANNDSLTYTLEGTDRASFAIDDQTGQIKTKTGVTYDHETKSSYAVTVKADDGNGGHATVAVTINVTDVDEPPLAPAMPRVSGASDESITVTWSPPNNAGRPGITQYEYQYKKMDESNFDGNSHKMSGTSTSITITGLDEGTSYDVQVRAYNDEGSGQWSSSGTGSTDRQRRSGGSGGGGGGGSGDSSNEPPPSGPVEPPPEVPTQPQPVVPEARPEIVKSSIEIQTSDESDDSDDTVVGSVFKPTPTPTPTPTSAPVPTPTPVPTSTPTPTPTPTPVPTSTPTPTPTPTPTLYPHAYPDAHCHTDPIAHCIANPCPYTNPNANRGRNTTTHSGLGTARNSGCW